MPAKRSRLVRSSSLGGSGIAVSSLVDTLPSLRFPNRKTPIGRIDGDQPKKAATERNRKAIFLIASPVKESAVGKGKGEGSDEIRDFQEVCFRCGKKFGAESEIFMYSYLRAFCSAECREIHIAMDEEPEKVSGKIAESKTPQQGSIRTKDRFGSVSQNRGGT